MPEATVNELLEECAVDVLSTMCFAGLDGESEGATTPCAHAVSAELEFEGSHRGCFAICMPRPTAECLSARFCGFPEDEPLPEEHAEAVVCELANMICGSFLSRMDPDRSFTLEPPRRSTECPGVARSWGLKRAFTLSEGLVEIFLDMKGEKQ